MTNLKFYRADTKKVIRICRVPSYGKPHTVTSMMARKGWLRRDSFAKRYPHLTRFLGRGGSLVPLEKVRVA